MGRSDLKYELEETIWELKCKLYHAIFLTHNSWEILSRNVYEIEKGAMIQFPHMDKTYKLTLWTRPKEKKLVGKSSESIKKCKNIYYHNRCIDKNNNICYNNNFHKYKDTYNTNNHSI